MRLFDAAWALATACALAGCSPAEAPAPPPEPAPSPPPAAAPAQSPSAAGGALYDELECAGCHESAAMPGLIVIPLVELGKRFTEESLASFLSAPPPPMPDYGLSEEEREQLAAFLLERP